ncbi:MAG: hypothetical protein R3F11_20190 [Verrucomicrobiales bacterium]
MIDDRGQPLRQLVEVAARQTHFRPKQNHAALFCLFITSVLVFLSVRHRARRPAPPVARGLGARVRLHRARRGGDRQHDVSRRVWSRSRF